MWCSVQLHGSDLWALGRRRMALDNYASGCDTCGTATWDTSEFITIGGVRRQEDRYMFCRGWQEVVRLCMIICCGNHHTLRDLRGLMEYSNPNIPIFMLDLDWRDELNSGQGVNRPMWKRVFIALITIFEIIGHPGGRILILCDAGRHRSVAFAAFVMYMLEGITKEQALRRAIAMRNKELRESRMEMSLIGPIQGAKGTVRWYAPVCGSCRGIIADIRNTPLCPLCGREAPFG